METSTRGIWFSPPYGSWLCVHAPGVFLLAVKALAHERMGPPAKTADGNTRYATHIRVLPTITPITPTWRYGTSEPCTENMRTSEERRAYVGLTMLTGSSPVHSGLIEWNTYRGKTKWRVTKWANLRFRTPALTNTPEACFRHGMREHKYDFETTGTIWQRH